MIAVNLPVINVTSGVQDAATCARCEGECCKRSPGIVHPGDLGPRSSLVEVLVAYVRTGRWAFDYWEGDPRPKSRQSKPPLTECYYLRPATIKAPGKVIDASWGGQCCLLTDAGCSLAFENRPRQCRELVPNPECPGRCDEPFSKQDIVASWAPERIQRRVRQAIAILCGPQE